MLSDSLTGLKDLRIPLRLHSLMREAGFIDVEYRLLSKPPFLTSRLVDRTCSADIDK